MSPLAVVSPSTDTEDVWWSLYKPNKQDWKEAGPGIRPGRRPKKKQLTVGDTVRINKTQRTFQKGYIPGWSKEIFKITKRRRTVPVTFEVEDYVGESIKGGFYESELQCVEAPTFFDVERVVKTRKRSGKTQYLVKWVGYPASFNSWVQDIKRF